ncbi:unnamed protein product [Coregonus sp. 'balchen']|nr:unnamed protein product [Coregonus sp. 'balchen']
MLLLNQFHDVIPGSCIEMVVEEALRYYQDIRTVGTRLLRVSCEALGSTGAAPRTGDSAVLNTLPWERTEVLPLTGGAPDLQQPGLALVTVPSVGVVSVCEATGTKPVTLVSVTVQVIHRT